MSNKGLGRGLEALFGFYDEPGSYKNITSEKKDNNAGVTEIEISN